MPAAPTVLPKVMDSDYIIGLSSNKGTFAPSMAQRVNKTSTYVEPDPMYSAPPSGDAIPEPPTVASLSPRRLTSSPRHPFAQPAPARYGHLLSPRAQRYGTVREPMASTLLSPMRGERPNGLVGRSPRGATGRQGRPSGIYDTEPTGSRDYATHRRAHAKQDSARRKPRCDPKTRLSEDPTALLVLPTFSTCSTAEVPLLHLLPVLVLVALVLVLPLVMLALTPSPFLPRRCRTRRGTRAPPHTGERPAPSSTVSQRRRSKKRRGRSSARLTWRPTAASTPSGQVRGCDRSRWRSTRPAASEREGGSGG